MSRLLLVRDYVTMKLGYKRIAYASYGPPNSLIQEIEPGVFIRPKGAMKTEVVLWFNIRARLRLLLSGKVQVVNIIWTEVPIMVVGDSFNWVILPPWEKVDPKLKV